MAPPQEPLHKQARRFALDVALGNHALSKFVPWALWLGDAVLCSLIIWKIPCEHNTPKLSHWTDLKLCFYKECNMIALEEEKREESGYIYIHAGGS